VVGIHLMGGTCPLVEVERVLSHLAGESAGQCGPCMFGLPAIADDWRRLGDPHQSAAALQRLQRRLVEIAGRGACRHPAGRCAVSPLIRVDPITCTGHGLCAHWLPERIDLDEWGYPVIDPAPLPVGLVVLAKRAVNECPVRALTQVKRSTEPT
jgi:ferredoxin